MKQLKPYIRADGSIDPPTAPIQRNGDLYVLTDNITCEGDAIVIQRSNAMLDGGMCWLEGNGTGTGLWLNAGNVTVHSFNILNFHQGILVNPSEFCRIDSNNLLNNWVGIRVLSSNNNIILCNNITGSSSFGIDVYMGYNNSLCHNTIADGGSTAISLYATSRYNSVFRNLLVNNVVGFYIANVARENYIFENSVVNNSWGISLGIVGGEINNTFWHNNFVSNTVQAEINRETILDDGYPSGGNYWSDYTGVDADGDGIGDTPYIIDSNNQDNYPLMNPWVPPDFAVTNVKPSQTIVGQGILYPFPPTINVTVENQGNKIEGYNLTVYANSTAVGTIYFTLTGGKSRVLTFNWNTTSFAKGYYIISAVLTPLAEELDTSDNVLVYGTVYLGVPGDVDGNHKVDMSDLYLVALNFGRRAPYETPQRANCDINNDGVIGMFDLYIVAVHYGQTDP